MSNEISIKKLQKFIKSKDFNPNLKQGYFLKLIEEVGELSEAIRKSFRKFNETLKLTHEEVSDIDEKIKKLISLMDNIEVKYQIVPREKTTCKRGEYCLLIYSEEKTNFLVKNISNNKH